MLVFHTGDSFLEISIPVYFTLAKCFIRSMRLSFGKQNFGKFRAAYYSREMSLILSFKFNTFVRKYTHGLM